MDQTQDYRDHAERVRSVLEARLGSDPGNPDRFGNGLFVFGGAEYGTQGKKGDAIWYVSRADDLLRRRPRWSYEWRAYTPEKVADELLHIYNELAP
jgi:hypothetical protein